MASPAFPEPPPSHIDSYEEEELNAIIEQLYAKREHWLNTDLAKRITLLEEAIVSTLAVAEDWVAAASEAKGVNPKENHAAEDWLGGPLTTIRNIRLLAEALKAKGQPRPNSLSTRPNGQIVAQVFPQGYCEKLLFSGFRGEVWLEPNKPASQGRIYASKQTHNRLALVLGAGNVSSIGPMDALYKLFVDNEVVLLKTNPVNHHLAPFFKKALSPIIEYGVLTIVGGDKKTGEYLCQHEKVESIHITGSDKTHDAILWGPDAATHPERKKNNTPHINKTITSELGCVTPIIVIPGPWSQKDLQYHARQVACMVTNNASFNCNAAKVLVLAQHWEHRTAFLELIRVTLEQASPRQAYYPGAQERYRDFLEHYPNAIICNPSLPQGTIPWTILPNVPPQDREYALQTEAFCGVLAEVTLPSQNTHEFFKASVDFANTSVWGNLSCGMLIHPKTKRQFPAELDTAIENLRYGGIAINVWPGIIYGATATSWGAFPSNSPENIQSGSGVVHNTFLFDHPQKSVLHAPFRIRPTPAWFCDHPNQLELAKRMTKFEAKPSALKLPGIIQAATKA